MNKFISATVVTAIRIINNTLLVPLRARKDFQQVFEKLYLIGVYGMNYGRVTDPIAGGEIATIQYLKEKLDSVEGEVVIFDVGANVGSYTMLLRKFFINNSLSVFAFEPSKRTYEELCEKLVGDTEVSKINIGLGNSKETVKLYTNTVSTLSSLYQGHYGEQDEYDEIQVDTIDSFCQENNVFHIHFLKIDVEGHEYAVLQGAQNMLNDNRISYIQFRVWP